MKKILLLGGLRYLIPVINAAHQQGYYVITADYLPDNYAHKFSDEYINIIFHFAWGTTAAAVKKGEPLGFLPDDAHPGNDDAFWGDITGFVDSNGDPADDSFVSMTDTDLYAVYTEDSYAWNDYSLP